MSDDDDSCVCVGLTQDEWKSLLNVVKSAAKREFQDEHDETADAVRELGKKVFEQVREE